MDFAEKFISLNLNAVFNLTDDNETIANGMSMLLRDM